MVNTERKLGLLKVQFKDVKAFREELCDKGLSILRAADIPSITENIFLKRGVINFSQRNIVEPENGYVGIRFSWNPKGENGEFDPHAEHDSVEVGVNVATCTLSFVQAGEASSLKGAGGMKLTQGVETLRCSQWLNNRELIGNALARAIDNPQRVRIPDFT